MTVALVHCGDGCQASNGILFNTKMTRRVRKSTRHAIAKPQRHKKAPRGTSVTLFVSFRQHLVQQEWYGLEIGGGGALEAIVCDDAVAFDNAEGGSESLNYLSRAQSYIFGNIKPCLPPFILPKHRTLFSSLSSICVQQLLRICCTRVISSYLH